MGKDYILVETVGVGQDEVDVVKSAHTTVILVMPGMGDDIQAIKAGILEVGDIFVINKAERDGVDHTESHLRSMLEMEGKKYGPKGWLPPVLRTVAVNDAGTDELLDEIDRHGRHLAETEQGLNRRKSRQWVHDELAEMLGHQLMAYVTDGFNQTGAFKDAVKDIISGKVDPYSACDDLIRPLRDLFKGR
jgi:LAO/AO transport system kinase